MTPEQRLVENLRAFPKVVRIYLFGSRARGDNAPRADIDVAISCPAASREEWLRIWDAAESTETLLHLDILRLEEAPEALRTRILEEGKLLYERDEA